MTSLLSTIPTSANATSIFTLAKAPTSHAADIPSASTLLTTPTPTQDTTHPAALGTAFLQEVAKLNEPVFVEVDGKTYKFEYPYKGASSSWSDHTSVGHVGTGRDIRAFKDGCNGLRRDFIDKYGKDAPYDNFTLTKYNGKEDPEPCAWITREADPQELARYDALSSGGGSVKVPLFVSNIVDGFQSLQMLLPRDKLGQVACASGLWPSACEES